MKKNRATLTVLIIIIISVISYFGISYLRDFNQKLTLSGQEISDTTLDEIQELEENRPPLEVYVLDQKNRPKDRGIPGTTYTADIYVVDNINKKVHGPYQGSSYPNSKKTKGKDRPNTVNSQMHLFNNKYGHKGSSVKGLNLIDDVSKRLTEGYSWSERPTMMKYVNLHSGFSDKGNWNSRGSEGCITLHPNQVKDFWKHFDFSIPRKNFETPKVYTKGKSSGAIFVSRMDAAAKTELIDKITKIYE